MKMWLHCTVILLLTGGPAAVALAEDAEGLVRVSGSGLNTETVLTPEKEFQGTKLCGSDLERRMHHLAALVVHVTGDWQLNRRGEKRCLDVKDFKVLRMTSGRDAVIGMFSTKDGAFLVTGDDGKAITLKDVPDGMKKLDGQKIIVDLKPVENPVAKETSQVVVTYQPFP